jgi:hypothetical protein
VVEQKITDLYPELMGIVLSMKRHFDRGHTLRDSANFEGLRRLAIRLESLRYLLNAIRQRPYTARINKERIEQVSSQIYDEAVALQDDVFFQDVYADRQFRITGVLTTGVGELRQYLGVDATFRDAMSLFLRLLLEGRRQGTLFEDKSADPVAVLRDMIPEQQIAPAQFDIVSDRLTVAYQQNKAQAPDVANIASALSALVGDGDSILKELGRTNCDRRLIESVERLQGLLRSEQDVVQLGLANIRSGLIHAACENELFDTTSALLRAYTVGVGMYVDQFPDWRRFVDNSATTRLQEGDAQRVASVLDRLIDQTEKRPDIVDEEVPRTLRFLRTLIVEPSTAMKKTVFASVRTIENLVARIFGYGIQFVDDTVRTTGDATYERGSKPVAMALLAIAAKGVADLGPIAARLGDAA